MFTREEFTAFRRMVKQYEDRLNEVMCWVDLNGYDKKLHAPLQGEITLVRRIEKEIESQLLESGSVVDLYQVPDIDGNATIQSYI